MQSVEIRRLHNTKTKCQVSSSQTVYILSWSNFKIQSYYVTEVDVPLITDWKFQTT
jgi:hypothetical protein